MRSNLPTIFPSLPILYQPSSSNSSRLLTMLTKDFLWALNHWWSLYHNNILLSSQCSPVLCYSNIPLCLFYHLYIQIQLDWQKYGNAFLEIAFSVTFNTQRRAPCCKSLMTAIPHGPKITETTCKSSLPATRAASHQPHLSWQWPWTSLAEGRELKCGKWSAPRWAREKPRGG